ncbi:MAG: NAD-dependent malic enzyme [Candidatus Nitrospinota bacterium M3_3B_026]
MSHYLVRRDETGSRFIEVDQSGSDLLHNPLLNKGTAFTESERRELSLAGLLPPHVSTMTEQLGRVYENYQAKPNDLERYVYLRALQDRNETLFYALLREHAAEMIPIIYTPTVGEAVRKGSHIYRYSRGLYISPANVAMMGQMIKNLPSQDIEVIVVTDNQGILGIGDQGIGGMGIPIGKLSLYTLAAGVPPAACLPICLDVGTDNEALLDDPLYLGQKHHRLTGEKYDSLIEAFVDAVKRHCPGALLQWEDFSKQNAFSNLDNYRGKILSFNDDIQGTGAVALAGILGAMRIKEERLTDQRFLIYGAGAGGIGVARRIKSALADDGLPEREALERIFVVDSHGLLTSDRKDVEYYKKGFAQPVSRVGGWSARNRERIILEEVIRNAGVTVLLGLSGQGGAFTRPVVEAMAANTHMPVIFPLSNPTSRAEAAPADIYSWTNGRAIVATGSPFSDVELQGGRYRVGQGNNVFIFPGVGLGTLAARARMITDEMFNAAARRLAGMIPADAALTRCVYPPVTRLSKVTEQVALAVFNTAARQGVADPPEGVEPLEAIRERIWRPEYLPYRKKDAAVPKVETA